MLLIALIVEMSLVLYIIVLITVVLLNVLMAIMVEILTIHAQYVIHIVPDALPKMSFLALLVDFIMEVIIISFLELILVLKLVPMVNMKTQHLIYA